jgi:hypothetical protein
MERMNEWMDGWMAGLSGGQDRTGQGRAGHRSDVLNLRYLRRYVLLFCLVYYLLYTCMLPGRSMGLLHKSLSDK